MSDPNDPRWRWLILLLRIASGIRLVEELVRWILDHLP